MNVVRKRVQMKRADIAGAIHDRRDVGRRDARCIRRYCNPLLAIPEVGLAVRRCYFLSVYRRGRECEVHGYDRASSTAIRARSCLISVSRSIDASPSCSSTPPGVTVPCTSKLPPPVSSIAKNEEELPPVYQ